MNTGHQRQHALEQRLAEAAAKLVAAEVEILETENVGQVALAAERWMAHAEAHKSLAIALTEYKVAANEWRATISDFKSGYVAVGEWKAEHGALETRIGLLEQGRNNSVASEHAIRDVFNQGRNLILLGLAILGGVITLAVFLRG